jgi:hypothetical protein
MFHQLIIFADHLNRVLLSEHISDPDSRPLLQIDAVVFLLDLGAPPFVIVCCTFLFEVDHLVLFGDLVLVEDWVVVLPL